jgi:hypothetical protein
MRRSTLVMVLALMPVCAVAVDWQNECIAEYDNLYYKTYTTDVDYYWDGADHIVWFDFDVDYPAEPYTKYIRYTYVPNPRAGGPPGFTELVYTTTAFTGVAIAVDRNFDPPVPYILYSDDENPRHVILASRVDGTWTSEIVRTFPEDPGEPYEVGDEKNHRIWTCGLAVGNDHSIHAAYGFGFDIVASIYAGGKLNWDFPYDVAYAKKAYGGTWELTNWLGTRERFYPEYPHKARKKYQQHGADIVLGSSDEPYVSFCEHQYWAEEPSYIFIATTDGSGEWFYEQVLEMDKIGDYWFFTTNTSLADKAAPGAVEPDLLVAFIGNNDNPGFGLARTYYVSHDGVEWEKELVYEYPMNTPGFDIEVLYGNYGPGVAFGEYGGGWPDATVYAALYARDPYGNWVNIMPVDRTAFSGGSITGAVKPDGYTDVFYDWGYTETKGGPALDALLWGAFELPGLDFTSGPGGEAFAVKPELARVFTAPNPASNVLNLKFELSGPGTVNVSTYDIAGRKIHAAVCEGAAGENTLRIPVAEWPRGVYIYNVVCGDSCKTGKAVVSR